VRTLEYQPRSLRISLTSLIDVVFILLLFFMLATTFSQWQQMTLSSVAKGKQMLSDKMPVQMFVLGGEQVRRAGKVYALGDPALSELLSAIQSEKIHLLVTAETRASVQDVVAFMDHVVAAGIENVSLTNSFDER
jgi:biopolymer transport protein ExbD